jgi:hypothetical protein
MSKRQKWVGTHDWGEYVDCDADEETIKQILARSQAANELEREALAGLEDTQESINAALSSIESAEERIDEQIAAVKSGLDHVNRDQEHASRTLDLLFNADSSSRSESDSLPRLAIAMLLKDPNLKALRTFVVYHSCLGFERFDFFLDDTNHEGADEPQYNDASAQVLEEFTSKPQVVVHRCSKSWWGTTAKPRSVIWDKVSWTPIGIKLPPSLTNTAKPTNEKTAANATDAANAATQTNATECSERNTLLLVHT